MERVEDTVVVTRTEPASELDQARTVIRNAAEVLVAIANNPTPNRLGDNDDGWVSGEAHTVQLANDLRILLYSHTAGGVITSALGKREEGLFNEYIVSVGNGKGYPG